MKILKEAKEYYPTYLSHHRDKTNRLFHVFGNIATLIYITFILFFTSISLWPLLIFTPFIVYPFAWFGHYTFEENRPATFEVNPIITKLCDWRMMWNIIKNRKL
jgi:hypothetical protein